MKKYLNLAQRRILRFHLTEKVTFLQFFNIVNFEALLPYKIAKYLNIKYWRSIMPNYIGNTGETDENQFMVQNQAAIDTHLEQLELKLCQGFHKSLKL